MIGTTWGPWSLLGWMMVILAFFLAAVAGVVSNILISKQANNKLYHQTSELAGVAHSAYTNPPADPLTAPAMGIAETETAAVNTNAAHRFLSLTPEKGLFLMNARPRTDSSTGAARILLELRDTNNLTYVSILQRGDDLIESPWTRVCISQLVTPTGVTNALFVDFTPDGQRVIVGCNDTSPPQTQFWKLDSSNNLVVDGLPMSTSNSKRIKKLRMDSHSSTQFWILYDQGDLCLIDTAVPTETVMAQNVDDFHQTGIGMVCVETQVTTVTVTKGVESNTSITDMQNSYHVSYAGYPTSALDTANQVGTTVTRSGILVFLDKSTGVWAPNVDKATAAQDLNIIMAYISSNANYMIAEVRFAGGAYYKLFQWLNGKWNPSAKVHGLHTAFQAHFYAKGGDHALVWGDDSAAWFTLCNALRNNQLLWNRPAGYRAQNEETDGRFGTGWKLSGVSDEYAGKVTHLAVVCSSGNLCGDTINPARLAVSTIATHY